MAERAGREFNAGSAIGRRLLGEWRAVLAEGVEPFPWKKSALSQGRVKRRGRVALAQDEAVAQRVGGFARVEPEHVPVSCDQDVHTGHRRRKMRRAGSVRHFDELEADATGEQV